MNIFFIGYRCTGKTTVGRILAEKIAWRFVDTDDRLVAEMEATISSVVQKRGWEYFRQREAKIIANVCANNEQVVSTGGGVILNPLNITAIKQAGVVVWLKSEPKTIAARMRADENTRGQRPVLTKGSSLAEVVDVLAERIPLYHQAADMEMATDKLSPDEIADIIIRSPKLKALEIKGE